MRRSNYTTQGQDGTTVVEVLVVVVIISVVAAFAIMNKGTANEQFQRQMKTSASASHNGRSSGRVADDPLLNEIVTEAQVLSVRQKETVLSYIRALKQKNE